MVGVFHLIVRTVGTSRLVLDDVDRHRLLIELRRAFTGNALGHCLMDNHAHLLAEGEAEALRRAFDRALALYARWFNTRHELVGPLRRGPVEALLAGEPDAIGRALRYIHRNPVKTDPPIATAEVYYPWSSARAFAGLAREPLVNVARAVEVVGRHAGWALPRRLELADLEVSPVPSAGPELILRGAAQVFGLERCRLVAARVTEPRAVAARAVYVTLGRLESYRDGQLARILDVSRGRVTQIAAVPVDNDAVRAVRTLLRVPELRAWLGDLLAFSGPRCPRDS
jgi:hypothetical protein